MRENRRKNLIKRLPLIWALIAAVLLAVVGSYAAYTSTRSVKRVVSTQGSAGLLFSSNVMQSVALRDAADSTWGETIVTLAGDNPAITVTVCNYEQGNAARVNGSDIDYTFSVTLVDKDGNEITDAAKYSLYSLGGTAFTGATMTASGTLTRDVAQKDSYVIKLAEKYLDEIYLKVSATPSDASASAAENHYLRRILVTAQYTATVADGWSGEFSYDETVSAGEYDAFNYELSGNGSGTVTLTWDTTKVTISPWFLQEQGITATNGSVTLSVNSDETPSYTIQFYRTAAAAADEDWDAVSGYVTTVFNNK